MKNARMVEEALEKSDLYFKTEEEGWSTFCKGAAVTLQPIGESSVSVTAKTGVFATGETDVALMALMNHLGGWIQKVGTYGFSPDGEVILDMQGVNATDDRGVHALKDFSLQVRAGEIVGIAGIDGNGQTELVYGLTGLDKPSSGTITLCGKDISHASIRHRGEHMSHIPEDRHKHGLVLDFTLEQNMVLQRFNEPRFENHGFINNKAVRDYAEELIAKFDVRSGQGPITRARSMSGGNQQKAIVAREIDKDPELLVAVQPTRGLDVGAIENVHKELVAQRDAGKAVLLVSLELDEVMDVPDRILVMYEGEIVGELDPKTTTQEELGLYMAGAKRDEVRE